MYFDMEMLWITAIAVISGLLFYSIASRENTIPQKESCSNRGERGA